jgi:hypothetical protein
MAGLWSHQRKNLGHMHKGLFFFFFFLFLFFFLQRTFKRADLSNQEPDFTEAEVISK